MVNSLHALWPLASVIVLMTMAACDQGHSDTPTANDGLGRPEAEMVSEKEQDPAFALAFISQGMRGMERRPPGFE